MGGVNGGLELFKHRYVVLALSIRAMGIAAHDVGGGALQGTVGVAVPF